MAKDMEHAGLEVLFEARTVAVIGASDNAEKIAGRAYHYLAHGDFEGEIYPVNATRKTVQGDRGYASLAEIGAPVDLAIIAVPSRAVRAAVLDCVAHNVRAAVLFAGGFGETGEAGRQAEAEIAEIAAQGGLRLLGPNCMGVMDFRRSLYASFSNTIQEITGPTTAGGIAVVSQSGALGNFMLTQAMDYGVPITKWIATGNESDIEFAEALDYMAQDPDVCGIVCYLEGARNGKRLKSALARAQANDVPVAILKVGATEKGAEAVRSHTDAVVGDDKLYDALFRKYGVHRVHSVADLLDLATIFASRARVEGGRLLLTSISGGVGVIMAEAAINAGLDLPGLSDAAAAELKARLPFLSASNPLDVTGQVVQDFSLLANAIEVAARSMAPDVVINFVGRIARMPAMLAQYEAALDRLEEEFPKTVFITAGMFDGETQERFRKVGRLIVSDPTRAVWSAEVLVAQHRRRHAAMAFEGDTARFARAAPESTPDEREGYDLLAGIGVPVPDCRVATSAKDAGTHLHSSGVPLVMKVLSADIAHKSDYGGVKLNIASADLAASAFDEIMANVSAKAPGAALRGVLTMPMEHDFTEIVIGAKIDPQLGASIMVGLGGIFVEVLKDVAIRPAPVSPKEAEEMLAELKAYPLLTGARGTRPRDLEAVAQAVSDLSQFAAANADWLDSIEINPFAASSDPGHSMALDCAVHLREGGTA